MHDDWARDYFEHGYGRRWTLDPPSADTQRDIDALWTLLGLTTEAGFLDVGCGHGRIAVTMAQRGARVTGLDFAADLLGRAKELAHALSVGVSWVRGDMRTLPFGDESMQAAILFDAFGFFEQEEDNLSVLRELARVVDRGGRVAVKVANAEPIVGRFRPTDREQRGETVVEMERKLLANPSRLVEDLVITGPQGTARYQRRQRLYDVVDMTSVLEATGFTVVTVLAAVTGTDFEPATSRGMVIVGERRALTPTAGRR